MFIVFFTIFSKKGLVFGKFFKLSVKKTIFEHLKITINHKKLKNNHHNQWLFIMVVSTELILSGFLNGFYDVLWGLEKSFIFRWWFRNRNLGNRKIYTIYGIFYMVLWWSKTSYNTKKALFKVVLLVASIRFYRGQCFKKSL